VDGHRFTIPGSCSGFLLEFTWLRDIIKGIVHCVRINLVGMKDIGDKKEKLKKRV